MRLTVLFFLTIFCFSSVYATAVMNLYNPNPQPQEAFVGTISTSGEFLESLTKEDIKFYEGRKEVYFDYDLYYYDNTYYFYVVFSREGNFIIKTSEILYSIAGEVASKKIEKNVLVKYNNFDNSTQEATNLLSIKPAIIYSLSNKTKLNFFNRGSSDLSISISDVSLEIPAYQFEIINVNLVEPISFIDVSTYKSFKVPVIFLGDLPVNNTNGTNEDSNESFVSGLLVFPEGLEISSFPNKTIKRNISLENNGAFNITSLDVVHNISMAVVRAPYSINPNSVGVLEIEMFSGSVSKNESIFLSYIENGTEYNLTIPVIIIINEASVNDSVSNEPTCFDYGGILCEYKCEGNSNFTSDGYCCYGDCTSFVDDGTDDDKGSFSGTGWIIGILIFIILGIIGYVIYKKYKKTNVETPDEKIGLSKKNYENRLSGAVSRH